MRGRVWISLTRMALKYLVHRLCRDTRLLKKYSILSMLPVLRAEPQLRPRRQIIRPQLRPLPFFDCFVIHPRLRDLGRLSTNFVATRDIVPFPCLPSFPARHTSQPGVIEAYLNQHGHGRTIFPSAVPMACGIHEPPTQLIARAGFCYFLINLTSFVQCPAIGAACHRETSTLLTWA